MLNRLVFILIVTVGIGFLLYEYIDIGQVPKNLPYSSQDRDIKTTTTKNKIETETTVKTVIQTETSHEEVLPITLDMLLSQNRFYDALAFYLDARANDNEGYKVKIETYLEDLAKTDAILALEFMQVFLDNVPESKIINLMISTYITEGDFPKAIELIIQTKENYSSEMEDKKLSNQLKNTAKQYMDLLLKREAYGELIMFLEEMISYDSADSFYTYRLAKLYMRLDKTLEASALLEELQYDEVYAQNVKTLLSAIDKEEEESYKYTIPLQKYGDHYTVNVYLDGIEFNLILDTGATYIFIDEDKASMLEVIRDDLVLKTAGNEISAKLCQASTMQTGNLQLSNIKVTIAPFKRDGVDGLLGMNFFKQFKFFIDQDTNMLYLDPK